MLNFKAKIVNADCLIAVSSCDIKGNYCDLFIKVGR